MHSPGKTPKEYRIIIADDHPVVVAGMKVLIESKPGFKVVGEATNGQELLDLVAKLPCEMVILDLNMPQMNGIEALEYLHMHFPSIHILVLTTHKERPFLKRSLSKGARGYLLKDESHGKLLSAIDEIRLGKKVISNEMTSLIIDDFSSDLTSPLTADLLSAREKEILHLTVNSLTSKEIAERLDISARTVEAHRANIREKLGITTQTELIKYAMEHNLI